MIDNPNDRIDRLGTLTYEQLSDCYKRTFSTGDGELVLEHLKQVFGEYVPPIGRDAHETDIAVGQQSVIIHIKNMLIQMQIKTGGNNESDD